jgi:hypothetical protein
MDKERLVRAVTKHDRGELGSGASPGRLAATTQAALQGGLLSQVQRSTEPLEVTLDTDIDYLFSLTVPEAS